MAKNLYANPMDETNRPETEEQPSQTEITQPTESELQAEALDVSEVSFMGDTENDDKNKSTAPPTDSNKKEIVPTPDEWLDIQGRKFKIPRGLRRSIFQLESGQRQTDRNGNTITSPKNAKGRTQVLPETAKAMGYPNVDNPYDNISAGIKYLRQGYDEAVKKGYKGTEAWEMASRGYLNGHKRQEQELNDGNLYTSEYAKRVLEGWDANLAKGERDDDWNDETYLTPYEKQKLGITAPTENNQTVDGGDEQPLPTADMSAKLGAGLPKPIDTPTSATPEKLEKGTQPQTPNGQADELSQIFAQNGLSEEDKQEFIVGQYDKESLPKFIGDKKVKKAIYAQFGEEGGNNLVGMYFKVNPNEIYIDPAKVNDSIKKVAQDIPYSAEEKNKIKASLGKFYGEYSAYLAKTKQVPTPNSLDTWRKMKNAQLKNDPTFVKINNPLDYKTTEGLGKDLKVSDNDPDDSAPTINSNDPVEIQAKVYGDASTVTDNNPNNPLKKKGLAEFYRHNGINPNDLTQAERMGMLMAYDKSLGKIRSIAPDGDAVKIKESALGELVNIIRNEGVGALDKPENTWIRQFAFNNKNLNEYLRANAIDAFDALAKSKYGGNLTAIDKINQFNQSLRDQIATGIVPQASYSREVNYSKYYEEAGGNYKIANRRIFSDTAKGLGFTDDEIRLYGEENGDLYAYGGYGKNKSELKDLSGFNEDQKQGGAYVSNYTLTGNAIKNLMDARNAIQSGYKSLGDYRFAINNSYANTIRQAGVDLAKYGQSVAEDSLKSANSQPDTILGNLVSAYDTAKGGVAKGFTSGVNRYANLSSNAMDIFEAIKTAKTTPFDNQRDSNLRDRQLDLMADSALNIIKDTPKNIDFEQYPELGKGKDFLGGYSILGGGKSIFGVTEGLTHFVTQLPIYALYGSSLASTFGTSAVINSIDQYYTGNLKSLSSAVAMDVALFGIGRAVNRSLAGEVGADGVRSGGLLFKVPVYGSKQFQSLMTASENVIGKSMAEKSGEFITKLSTKAGTALGLTTEQAGKIANWMPLVSANSNLVAQTFGKYVANTTEGVYQFSLPLLKSYIDANLTAEGKKLKSQYDLIKSGKEISYGKDEYGKEIDPNSISIEERNAIKQNIVQTYDDMVSAFSAQGLASNLAMTVALPFMHSSQNDIDAQVIKDAKGNISLAKGEKVYTSLVEGADGQKYAEYSALVNLPSGRQEYLVLPKDSSLIRDALQNGNLVRTSKDVIDKKLFISRVGTRIKSKEEYEAIASISQEAMLKTLDGMSPIFNEDAKQKFLDQTSQAMQNVDALVKQDLSQKQLEVQELKKFNDKDLNTFLEQEKKASAEKEAEITAIDKKLKEENLSDEERKSLNSRFKDLVGNKTAEEVDIERGLGSQPKSFLETAPDVQPLDSIYQIQDKIRQAKDGLSVDSLSTAEKKDVAKLVTENKAQIDDSGIIRLSTESEKESAKTAVEPKLSVRDKELSNIDQSAKELSDKITEKQKFADGTPIKDSDVKIAYQTAQSKEIKEKDAEAIIKKGDFANLTSFRGDFTKEQVADGIADIKKTLENQGFSVYEAEGRYGDVEPSLFITGKEITDKDLQIMKDLGSKYSQDQILVGKGGEYFAPFTNKESEFYGTKENVGYQVSLDNAKKDFYTEVKFPNGEKVRYSVDDIFSGEKDNIRDVLSPSKQGEAMKVATAPQKTIVEPTNAKEEVFDGESLVGKTLKYKNSNKTVEVQSESKNSVTTSTGETIHKSLLNIPIAKKTASVERPSIDVETKSKVDTSAPEFAKDNSNSVARVTTDSSLVVNDAFMKKLESVVAGGDADNTSVGLQLTKSQVKELSTALERAGHTAEAEALSNVQGKDGLILINGSKPKNIEINSGHEFVHKNRTSVIKGEFTDKDVAKINQNGSLTAVREAIPEGNYYKTVSDSDLVDEVLAYGLTDEPSGLKVSQKVLDNALTDVIAYLSDKYSKETIQTIVDKVLMDMDEFAKSVKMDEQKVEDVKSTIKNKAIEAGLNEPELKVKLGLREVDYERPENTIYKNQVIRQSIVDSNERQSFVSFENLPNQRTERASEDVIRKGNTVITTKDSESIIPSDKELAKLGLKHIDPDNKKLRDWFGKSQIVDEEGKPKMMFHGTQTVGGFDVFDINKVSVNNLAFHIGTIDQASHFADGQNGSIQPVFVKIDNPLEMQDDSGWGASSILNFIRNSKKYKSLTNGEDYKEAVTNVHYFVKKSLYDLDLNREERETYQRIANNIAINYLKSKGFDGIKYVNRFEGLKEGIFSDSANSISDKDYIEKYGAEYSYIAFDPTQIKSAIGNNGEFSPHNPSILFKKDDEEVSKKTFGSPTGENHNLTLARLTPTGDPFTFTNISGAEHREAVSTNAKPVFNFFVKDVEDNSYHYEHQFGKDGNPLPNLKQFETNSSFRLYDVYQKTMETGVNLFRELGRARAIEKLMDEGYDGFYNSYEDVGKMFRNRVSLFDTPSNRTKVSLGNTSAPKDENAIISNALAKDNLETPKVLKKLAEDSVSEDRLALDIDKELKDIKSFNFDSIDFANEVDAKVVNDYISGYSFKRTGDRNSMSHRQVKKILVKYEVPIREAIFDTTNNLTPEQLQKAIEIYQNPDISKQKSLGQLSSMFGVGRESIARQFRDNGIEIEDALTASLKNPRLFYKVSSKYSTSDNRSIGADSSYELGFLTKLENDDNVKDFDRYKGSGIPYTINGRNRAYFPDFIVRYKDGTTDLVEIKPDYMLNDETNLAKFEAGRKYSDEKGYNFKVIGAKEIGFDAFSGIDINRVEVNSPEALKSIKNGIQKAKRYVKATKTIPKTEDERKEHYSQIQVGLKKVLDSKEPQLTPDEERETNSWLESYRNGSKIKADSSKLSIGEGQAQNIFDKVKTNEDFEIENLNSLAKKYKEVSTDIPKGIDNDAELIAIALRGIAGKDWYKDSNTILNSFRDSSLGKYIPSTFIRLVGATGQGMSPRENFAVASKYYNRMMSGVYGDNPKESIELLKQSGVFNGDGRYKLPASNIADAMGDRDLSTRKLNDYTQALLGDENRVVVDEWMLRLFAGKNKAPSPIVYDYIEGRVRHLAKVMNLTPAQVQAMLWSGYKDKVGEFLQDQVAKAPDDKDAKSLMSIIQSMAKFSDFNQVIKDYGLEESKVPDFPTAMAVAKYKDQILSLVAPQNLPKVEKGKIFDPQNFEKTGRALAYYYDLNRPSADQARVVVNSKAIDDFLTQNPQMVKDLSAVYESLYLNSKGTVPNKDLGKTGEIIFKSAYLKDKGVPLTDENLTVPLKASKGLFAKKDEEEQIKNLHSFDEAEWLDLATNFANNKMLSADETQKIKNLVASKDLKGLQSFVGGLNKQGFLEFISTLRRAGLLSGIKTSARNITANAMFQALEEVSRIPASTLDIGRSMIFGKDRTIQGASPIGLTRSLYKAITEGVKQGADTILNGENYFNYDDIRIAREKSTGYKIIDSTLGNASKLVFRALSAQDQVFRKFAEERAKYEIAKLRSKNNKTNVNDEYQNLNEADLSQADFLASVAVFQNENKLNSAYQRFRGNRSETVKFLLDMKLPFAKTTSNIFDRLLDYSGIWGVVKALDKDKQAFKSIISDDETARAFSFAVSKGMVGMGLMGVGYSLAQKGLLYGFADDSDEALKKIQELENSGSGMIKIGDRWYDISSVSPISSLFLTGATYYRMKQKQQQEIEIKANPNASEEEKNQLQSKAQKYVNITKILLNLAQQSPFVKAGVDLTSNRFYGSPFDFDNLVPVDSFVPSIVAEMAQLGDPIKRNQFPNPSGGVGTKAIKSLGLEGTEVGDYLGSGVDKIEVRTKNRIPYLRNSLEPKKNVFGNNIKQPFGFDPFLSQPDTSSEVSQEAKRLGYNIPVPKRKTGQSPADYAEIKKESGDVVSDILNSIVGDDKYKESNDSTKSRMLEITKSIKKDLTKEQRLHNVQVLLTREKLKKDVYAELDKAQYKMSDKEKKSFFTSLFSSAMATQTRSVKEGKQTLKNLTTNLKSTVKEKYDSWSEVKESREESKADNEDK